MDYMLSVPNGKRTEMESISSLLTLNKKHISVTPKNLRTTFLDLRWSCLLPACNKNSVQSFHKASNQYPVSNTGDWYVMQSDNKMIGVLAIPHTLDSGQSTVAHQCRTQRTTQTSRSQTQQSPTDQQTHTHTHRSVLVRQRERATKTLKTPRQNHSNICKNISFNEIRIPVQCVN